MGMVLQLVETGAGTRGRSIDLMEIDRPGDLRDIANLGSCVARIDATLTGIPALPVLRRRGRSSGVPGPACG